MTDCGCQPTAADTPQQRRILKIALGLNGTMFVVGVSAGIVARSSGLIADGLDMLADAIAYAIALAAAGRTDLFKAAAARTSGFVLLTLGIVVLLDVIRRLLTGEAPEGWIMIAVAAVAFAVNLNVLRLLRNQRSKEVHFRATVTFTQVDVIVNLAVIVSGVIVIATGFRFVDLAVGAAIGAYVIKEALEIIKEANEAREAAY
ncbi:MAG: cation transporter [Pseudomonadota bacterium]